MVHLLLAFTFILLCMHSVDTGFTLFGRNILWSESICISFTNVSLTPREPLTVGSTISNEHSVDHDKYSDFSGPPTLENTKAWEDLIQRTFFLTQLLTNVSQATDRTTQPLSSEPQKRSCGRVTSRLMTLYALQIRTGILQHWVSITNCTVWYVKFCSILLHESSVMA